METNRLIKRLLSLRNWEAFNVPFFLALLVLWIRNYQPPTWYLTAFSVGLVCYMLVQGTIYWHLKARSLIERRRALPAYFRRLFTRLRLSTLALLALYPVLALTAWFLNLTRPTELFWASAIAFFALLEYINYYHYQLMHDNLNDLRYLFRHKRLRKSPLAVDLALAPSDAHPS